MTEHRILVGVTGASGALYAERLIEVLLPKVQRLYLVATQTGKQVVEHELRRRRGQASEVSLTELLAGKVPENYRQTIRIFQEHDLFAPVASGSSVPTAMVVIPCSMGSLARIAHGMSSNLLERAADVALKQRRPLLLVPRETPLNAIHLQNMLTLAQLGCSLVPAMPGFYQRPETIVDLADFIAGKVCECLGIPHELYPPWNPRMT